MKGPSSGTRHVAQSQQQCFTDAYVLHSANRPPVSQEGQIREISGNNTEILVHTFFILEFH